MDSMCNLYDFHCQKFPQIYAFSLSLSLSLIVTKLICHILYNVFCDTIEETIDDYFQKKVFFVQYILLITKSDMESSISIDFTTIA